MMFCQPKTLVTQAFHMPRQIGRARDRLTSLLTRPHPYKIKHRNC